VMREIFIHLRIPFKLDVPMMELKVFMMLIESIFSSMITFKYFFAFMSFLKEVFTICHCPIFTFFGDILD
jgi:hypothetical protein